jgi:formylglycine-generating enzyme required for sulfatase activity
MKSPYLSIAYLSIADDTFIQRQTERAEKLQPEVPQKNSIGKELTLNPPGEVMMGSPAKEVQRAGAIEQREVPQGWPMHYFLRKVQVEAPEHKVMLPRPFLLGTHEVTVAQWDAFVKESGYQRVLCASRNDSE